MFAGRLGQAQPDLINLLLRLFTRVITDKLSDNLKGEKLFLPRTQ